MIRKRKKNGDKVVESVAISKRSKQEVSYIFLTDDDKQRTTPTTARPTALALDPDATHTK